MKQLFIILAFAAVSCTGCYRSKANSSSVGAVLVKDKVILANKARLLKASQRWVDNEFVIETTVENIAPDVLNQAGEWKYLDKAKMTKEQRELSIKSVTEFLAYSTDRESIKVFFGYGESRTSFMTIYLTSGGQVLIIRKDL